MIAALFVWPAHGQPDLAAESHRGKELMAAGRFEEAIPVYRQLVNALPDNPGPLFNLGLALHLAGHEREAVIQLQAVINRQPGHVPAHLYLGTAYLGLKEPQKAIEPLGKVIRAEPNNKEARLALGEALLSLERFQPAAEDFEKLSKLNPKDPKAWSGLGQSYEGLAGRSFEQLEKAALGSAYWLVLVAEARARGNQYNQAFFFYREALAKVPTLRGVHLAVAEIYKKNGHADWAAVEEEKERKLSPLSCSDLVKSPKSAVRDSTVDRGSAPAPNLECAFQAGRYREMVTQASHARTVEEYYWRTRAYNQLALKAFSRLALLPPSAEVHELIAEIYFHQRNYTESAKQWQQALQFSPGSDYYQKQLAISFNMSRQYEAARPILEELLKHTPDSAELNYWLGSAWLGLTKARESVPFFEKAVQLDPSGVALHRDLARAYLESGQAEKAIPHFKTAVEMDQDGSVYYQLARAYRSTGQRELEKEALKKFADIQASMSVEKKNLEQQAQITAP
jgi:tetratricopeptide (TPR) repeat protein